MGDYLAVLEGLVAKDVVAVVVGEEEVGHRVFRDRRNAPPEVCARDGVLGVHGGDSLVHDDDAYVTARLPLTVGVDLLRYLVEPHLEHRLTLTSAC